MSSLRGVTTLSWRRTSRRHPRPGSTTPNWSIRAGRYSRSPARRGRRRAFRCDRRSRRSPRSPARHPPACRCTNRTHGTVVVDVEVVGFAFAFDVAFDVVDDRSRAGSLRCSCGGAPAPLARDRRPWPRDRSCSRPGRRTSAGPAPSSSIRPRSSCRVAPAAVAAVHRRSDSSARTAPRESARLRRDRDVHQGAREPRVAKLGRIGLSLTHRVTEEPPERRALARIEPGRLREHVRVRRREVRGGDRGR